MNSNFESARANIQNEGITIFKTSPEKPLPRSRTLSRTGNQRYDDPDHSFASESYNYQINPNTGEEVNKQVSTNDMVKMDDRQSDIQSEANAHYQRSNMMPSD